MKISKVRARYIYDSRGVPTVEADVYLADGHHGRASVPSGASTGSYEAHELRDGHTSHHGKGVERAVRNINVSIAHALVGKTAASQSELDKKLINLDGTKNKSKLGANAMLAVSLAYAKAKADENNQPLFRYFQGLAGFREISMPVPFVNVLNGGKHAVGGLSIQERMLVPHGAKSITEALQMASETFQSLKEILQADNQPTTVGDEGGFAPKLQREEAGLDLLVQAIKKAGYEPGKDISLALDVAANELLHGHIYKVGQEELSSDELIAWYEQLIKKYPIVSIEDGLHEDDWDAWTKLTEQLGEEVQLVGDDLFVTNTHRLQQGIDKNAANAILIKPNQIGTVTETIETVKLAKKNGFGTMISHRSGETEDTAIAHLAVGLNAGQLKAGSFSRTDRLAKYNELLRIQELAPHASMAKLR